MLGRMEELSTAHDLATDGNLVYLADGAEGLAVVDVGDPEQPRLLRHWKYWTVSEPCATACRLERTFMPGSLRFLTRPRVGMLGTLSISMKGLPPFIARH